MCRWISLNEKLFKTSDAIKFGKIRNFFFFTIYFANECGSESKGEKKITDHDITQFMLELESKHIFSKGHIESKAKKNNQLLIILFMSVRFHLNYIFSIVIIFGS